MQGKQIISLTNKITYLPLHLYNIFENMTFSCEKQKTPSFPPRKVVSIMLPESAKSSVPSKN